MKHKKVIEQWYEVNFDSSHRYLGGKIDSFLDGSPLLDDDKDVASEMWEDNHTVLRDYEGDFEGVTIYHTDDTKPLIQFICDKLGIEYEDVKGLNFKLVG